MIDVIDIRPFIHPHVGGVYEFGFTAVRVTKITGDIVVYEQIGDPSITNIMNRGRFAVDNWLYG